MNCQPTGLDNKWSKKARESKDARDFIVSSSRPNDWSNSATATMDNVDDSEATLSEIGFRERTRDVFVNRKLNVPFFTEKDEFTPYLFRFHAKDVS